MPAFLRFACWWLGIAASAPMLWPASLSQRLKLEELTRAETYVVEQIAARQPADLTREFPAKNDRVLRARFLADLLTHGIEQVDYRHRMIHIRGALIREPLDLRNSVVKSEVWLNDSTFEHPVTFADVAFHRDVSFQGSVFEQAADFRLTDFRLSASLDKAQFKSAVNFSDAVIGRHFEAKGAQFRKDLARESPEFHDIIFSRLKATGRISFIGAAIAGKVHFDGVTSGDELDFGGCKFWNTAQFNYAHAGQNLLFTLAQFLSSGVEIDLDGVRVDSDLAFTGGEFRGSVTLSNAQVAGNLIADSVTVFGRGDGVSVSLSEAKIGGFVNLSYATIYRGLEFKDSTIGGSLDLTGAIFSNTPPPKEEQSGTVQDQKPVETVESPCVFTDLKIGQTLRLNEATFTDSTSFLGTTVGKSIQGKDVRFTSSTPVLFTAIKVEREIIFKNAAFAGGFIMQVANCDALVVEQQSNKGQGEIDLSGTTVNRLLRFEDLGLSTLVAVALKVDGNTEIKNCTIQSADLSHASLGSVDFEDLKVGSPDAEQSVLRMTGMNYRSIVARAANKSSDEVLLNLIDFPGQTPDAYATLEAFLTRQGKRDEADKIYVRGRHRERDKLNLWDKFTNYALFVLVRYGRAPWQALIPCALFVGFGTLLFRPHKMESRDPTGEPEHYNGFWYSLSAFLPFVELPGTRHWRPKVEHRPLLHYMRVHVILGWILVPVALASVGGFLN